MENQQVSSRVPSPWIQHLFALSMVLNLLTPLAAAQRTSQPPDNGDNAGIEKKQSKPTKLARMPIEWLIGPYIPVQGPLQPDTN